MSTIQVTPQNLRKIATTCKTQAGEVAGVQRTVNTAIVSSGWKSPAATKFTQDWNTHYVKALKELERALRELGTAADAMATNYESTEQAYKGAR